MCHSYERWLMPAEFGLLNAGLIFGNMALMVATFLPLRLTLTRITGDPHIIGYAVNAPAIVVLIVSLIMWAWAQRAGVITHLLRAYPIATLAATLFCGGLLLWFFGPAIIGAIF